MHPIQLENIVISPVGRGGSVLLHALLLSSPQSYGAAGWYLPSDRQYYVEKFGRERLTNNLCKNFLHNGSLYAFIENKNHNNILCPCLYTNPIEIIHYHNFLYSSNFMKELRIARDLHQNTTLFIFLERNWEDNIKSRVQSGPQTKSRFKSILMFCLLDSRAKRRARKFANFFPTTLMINHQIFTQNEYHQIFKDLLGFNLPDLQEVFFTGERWQVNINSSKSHISFNSFESFIVRVFDLDSPKKFQLIAFSIKLLVILWFPVASLKIEFLRILKSRNKKQIIFLFPLMNLFLLRRIKNEFKSFW